MHMWNNVHLLSSVSFMAENSGTTERRTPPFGRGYEGKRFHHLPCRKS